MACIKKTFICSLVVSASFMAETMFLLFVWSFSDLRILAEEIRKCHAIDYRQMPTSYFFSWWGPLQGVRCHKLFAEYAFSSSASAEKESSPSQSFECCRDLWKGSMMGWMGDTLVLDRVRLWEFYWFAQPPVRPPVRKNVSSFFSFFSLFFLPAFPFLPFSPFPPSS